MKKRWYIFRTWFLCRERLIREVRELLDRADRLEAENEHLRHRRWRYCGRDIILPLNRIRIPIYMTPPRQDKRTRVESVGNTDPDAQALTDEAYAMIDYVACTANGYLYARCPDGAPTVNFSVSVIIAR